ncbi:MAG: VOC family protein [Propionibacteriales bacterium]|nr:VOC family protein [Propionibacteriales bacterium]
MFVNLPVKDLDLSVRFFTGLGFTFNPDFTDERATAMIVNEEAFVMLLVEDFFTTFTGKPVPSPSEVVIALSAESPGEVDDLVERALASGGAKAQERIADGPMYGWSFLDPDGHHWELIHMDLSPG